MIDKATEAQVRRDRQRLVVAADEIAGLRRRVHALERSPAARALMPARRLLHAMAPLAIAARDLLRGRPSVPQSPWADDAGRGRALVIDHCWPQPDRDAGSVEIVNLVEALQRLGFTVVMAAHQEHAAASPARDALVQRGIRCLTTAHAGSVEEFILSGAERLDLCVLCRVYCGGEFFETVSRACPATRIVFNTIDLTYLREERRAQHLQDPALLAIASQIRAREEHLIRHSDAAIVVSAAELALLAQTIPEAFVVQMPLARPVQPPVMPWQERRGLGFIGGFAHAPNIDAVRYFLADIWPLVLQDMPDCRLSLVGEGLPPDILAGCPAQSGAQVSVLGHVPDIGPWFESLRLTVAPLRFGAGAKGKIASSLAAGVPCIATPVAAEGMGLDAATGVMVGETPAAFAAAIRAAYTDAGLWQALSAGGLDYAARMLSPARWQTRLDEALQRLGL